MLRFIHYLEMYILFRFCCGPSSLEQTPEEEWSMVEDMSLDEKDFKMGGKLPLRERKGVNKENMPA